MTAHHGRPCPRRHVIVDTGANPSSCRAPAGTPINAVRARGCLPPQTLHALAFDLLAAKVTGPMVNAGVATIDRRWQLGQDLTGPLSTYLDLAHRALPRYTGGLWTLVAWIYWRSRDRQSCWFALELALEIDPDIDLAHTLAVFMHQNVDPDQVPVLTFR